MDMQAQADEASKKRDNADLLLQACNLGLLADVEELIEGQGCPANVSDKNGVTALQHAAAKGSADIVRYLLNHGADLETEDKDGRTPLHVASLWDHHEVIKLLVSRKAYLDGQDKNDETPLHLAVRQGSIETVDLLCSLGASTALQSKLGQTPLGEALNREKLDVAELLVSKGADVNARPRGYSLLHLALGMGKIESAAFLLRKGVDPNKAVSKEMLTPLHTAVLGCELATVKMLLNHKPTKGQSAVDVNALTSFGDTPLDLLPHADKMDAKMKEAAPLIRAELLKKKARPGAEIKAEAERAKKAAPAKPSPVQLFRESKKPEQDQSIHRWTTLDESSLKKEGLGEDAIKRCANLKKLEKDLEVHEAVQVLRDDGRFQTLMQDKEVTQAFEEVRKDCNYILKWNSNERVMYVMNKFKNLQKVLRPHGMQINIQDLLIDQTKPHDNTSKVELGKLKMIRGAEFEAIRASAMEPDPEKQKEAAEAAGKAHVQKLLREQQPKSLTAGEERGDDANQKNEPATSKPKDQKELRAQQEKEFNEMLDKAMPKGPTYDTWGEWWTALFKNLAKQLAMVALMFGILYVGKLYGFGPLAELERLKQMEQQAEALKAGVATPGLQYADAIEDTPTEDHFEGFHGEL